MHLKLFDKARIKQEFALLNYSILYVPQTFIRSKNSLNRKIN